MISVLTVLGENDLTTDSKQGKEQDYHYPKA
jgi:hypothetical protein